MQPVEGTIVRRRWGVTTALACAALLAMMFALAWFASQSKSPTFDEPLHAIGGYLRVFHRDYRANPEDPPLWSYWAMLPHARNSLQINFDDPDWEGLLAEPQSQLRFCTRTLFQTAGNDGVAFVQRSRTAMLLVAALLLGPVIAWWAWKLGGGVCAVTATTLLALDPNFLAHAALVKNDVAISFCMLVLATVTWWTGRRLTWWNAPLAGLVCGVALGVKFSGLVLPVMLAAMLLARTVLPTPWMCFGRDVMRRGSKLLVALGLCALAGLTCWVLVWAAYGFRFDVTPKQDSRLPLATEVKVVAVWNYFLRHNGQFPTDAQLAHAPPGWFADTIVWAEHRRLLPQSWLYGLLFTYRSTLARSTFLLGEYSDTGWWYYFPLAMLFKTPLGTLTAIALALVTWFALPARNARGSATGQPLDRWTFACLAIPLMLYSISALTSNLNLGLRHVLPVYPFIYLLVGIAAARAARARFRPFCAVAIVLIVALAVETVAAFPNYIAFFNAVFKPHCLKLLSDSNLDWGQDLPLLAEWQRRHSRIPLYFCYFGTTDPAVYGINYINVPGGFWLNPPFVLLHEHRGPPAVLAISATPLQGVNVPPSLRRYYAPLRAIEPSEIIGGSIYLYPLPLPPGAGWNLPRTE